MKQTTMKKQFHSQGMAGFSIVEVMMALSILGIGLISVTGLTVKNVLYNNKARHQSAAYTWAMDEIEQLQGMPFAQVRAIADTNNGIQEKSAQVDSESGRYAITTQVTDNGLVLPNSFVIQVEVRLENSTLPTAKVNTIRIEG